MNNNGTLIETHYLNKNNVIKLFEGYAILDTVLIEVKNISGATINNLVMHMSFAEGWLSLNVGTPSTPNKTWS